MAVRIRLSRTGRKNRPFYRLCAMDSRTSRDGSPIEVLGHYDPLVADVTKNTVVVADRVRYWLSVGARPAGSTVESILRRHQIAIPVYGGKKKKKKPEAAGAATKKGAAKKRTPAEKKKK